jgi:hypothetical protein
MRERRVGGERDQAASVSKPAHKDECVSERMPEVSLTVILALFRFVQGVNLYMIARCDSRLYVSARTQQVSRL